MWSLGVVLYELATYKRPFEANNSSQLVQKILKAKYQPIHPIYSPDLIKAIELCLTKEFKKRPTVSELLDLPCNSAAPEPPLALEPHSSRLSHTVHT